MLAKMSYFLFLVCLSFINSLKAEQNVKIKAIAFDFGGVIAKTNTEEVINFIAMSLDISKNDASDSLKQLKAYTNEGGKESTFWKIYLDSISKELSNNWLEELKVAKFHALKEIPGMVALVKDLQTQGYLTALLSNVRESQAQIKSQLGYYKLFSPLLLSYAIGVKKPNPQAYYLLLDYLKMPPEAVLFIDNKKANIEAAQALGLDSIKFIHTHQLIAALQQRGIKISTALLDEIP